MVLIEEKALGDGVATALEKCGQYDEIKKCSVEWLLLDSTKNEDNKLMKGAILRNSK